MALTWKSPTITGGTCHLVLLSPSSSCARDLDAGEVLAAADRLRMAVRVGAITIAPAAAALPCPLGCPGVALARRPQVAAAREDCRRWTRHAIPGPIPTTADHLIRCRKAIKRPFIPSAITKGGKEPRRYGLQSYHDAPGHCTVLFAVILAHLGDQGAQRQTKSAARR